MNKRTYCNLLLCFCLSVVFSNVYGQDPEGYQRLFFDDTRNLISTCSSPTGGGGYFIASIFNATSVEEVDSIGITVSKHDAKGDILHSFDYIIDEAEYSLSNKTLECTNIGGDTLVVVAIDETTVNDIGNKFLLKLDQNGLLIFETIIQDTLTGMTANAVDYLPKVKVLPGFKGDYTYLGTHDHEEIVGIHYERLDTIDRRTITYSYYGSTTDSLPEDINIALSNAAIQMDSSMVLSFATPGDNTTAGLMRLDSLGQPIQAQLYQIEDLIDFNIEFTAITETPDTGFVAVGYCEHNALSESIVVKLDSAMNVTWAKRIDLEVPGTIHRAQDVVVSQTGDIVIGGSYLTAFINGIHGNYAVFLSLDGEITTFPRKFESENALTAEVTSGYSSNLTLNNILNDMSIAMSTTGATMPPLGLAPIMIKMTQEGSAMCEDSLTINNLNDLVFSKDTMALVQTHLAVRADLESTVKPHSYDVPVVVLGQASYCPRDTVTHTFVATSENAISYLWSTGDTTETLDVDMSMVEAGETQEYAVTVTFADRICYTLCDTGSVMKTDFPTATIGLVTTEYCPNTTVDLIVNSSNGTAGGILWENPADMSFMADTSRITVPADPGTVYTVRTIDSCEDTARAMITIPDLSPPEEVQITDDRSALCEEGVIFLTADWQANQFHGPGSTYIWAPNGETTSQITVTENGEYSVTITDNCNVPHVASGSFNIDDIEIPEPTVDISFALDIDNCGGVLTADGNVAVGPPTYVWSNNVIGNQSSISMPGTYMVTLTDACGQSVVEEITVTAADLDIPDPVVSITDRFDAATCTFVLTATGEVTAEPEGYVWSNNVIGNQSSVDMPGIYMVTLTDACGQEVIDQIVLSEADFIAGVPQFPLTISAVTDTIDCSENLIVEGAPAGATYLWSTGETTQEINVVETGLYTVTVQVCETVASAEYTRTVDDEFRWPNIFFPVDGQLEGNDSFGPQVECVETKTAPYLLEIYNRWGKKVFETTNIEDRWRGTLNNQGNFLEEGVYLFQATYDGELLMPDGGGHVTLIRSI